VRFELLTYMTLAECNKALQERLQSSRQFEGWTEKDGTFALAVSSKVARAFSRRTRLQGHMKREKGITTITGYVPDGVAPRQRAIILIGMELAGVFLLVSSYSPGGRLHQQRSAAQRGAPHPSCAGGQTTQTSSQEAAPAQTGSVAFSNQPARVHNGHPPARRPGDDAQTHQQRRHYDLDTQIVVQQHIPPLSTPTK